MDKKRVQLLTTYKLSFFGTLKVTRTDTDSFTREFTLVIFFILIDTVCNFINTIEY